MVHNKGSEQQFISKSHKFVGTKVPQKYYSYYCPESLKEEAKLALNNSKECVNIFGNVQNISNSQEACRKNRITVALVYLIRCVFHDFETLDGELKQFRGDINRTIYYNKLLIKKNKELLKNNLSLKDKEKINKHNDLLDKYTNSELRRLRIVDALLEKNIQNAENFLRDTTKNYTQD